MTQNGPKNLTQLLDQAESPEGSGRTVSFGDIMDAVGERSFGAVITLAGIIMLAPIIGDIPGATVVPGAVVLITAIQILMGRDHFWLPDALLRRSVKRQKLTRALEHMRRPARFIDNMLERRLEHFTGRTGRQATSILCIAIALATPVMEVVPFTANGAGLALTAFGLALIARDGLLALIAYAFTVGTFVAVAYALF